MKKFILLIIFLLSCTPHSPKNILQNFTVPLLKDNTSTPGFPPLIIYSNLWLEEVTRLKVTVYNTLQTDISAYDNNKNYLKIFNLNMFYLTPRLHYKHGKNLSDFDYLNLTLNNHAKVG